MDYRFKLEQFEGPLSLLLHLIDKAKVDIRDIFVSQITEQYLEYIRESDILEMESASEFITMAATLLYIKSKSLLPSITEQEGEEDEESEIIRQLEEYREYKRLCDQLRSFEDAASKSFYKMPEEYMSEPPDIRLEGVSVEALFRAFDEILISRETERGMQRLSTREIVRDRFTIQERVTYLERILAAHKKITFRQLFDSSATRMEIICTFSAMLEMLMSGSIRLRQVSLFGEISIEKVERQAKAEE
ncbi:MAG: segregation and condensation protein A [Christensenellales bacterium]